ncbi:hypothetical protein [Bradyrhizobium sp. SZCCHNS3002]|uniref:head-tail joining protein n=1 Tax=Bradyrhizobium sp. SZCCHNS3002 TaxID=3057310 RepID=UPI0028ED0A3B|nr:hypothetical protein [Bradyrhizobium sp. SZCCHNS3002]
MPIESDADRAAFVNPDEFGAVAIYTPAGGAASAPFHGQFDDPSDMTDINDVMTIDVRPTFFCRAVDLPGAASTGAGDGLQVAGEGTFHVVSIEPDGTGMVLLRLGAG